MPTAGDVRARTESRLGFRVGGKITQRHAEIGQHVKAGTVLAQLDPQDFRLAADAARAQVAAILGSHEDEIVFTGGGTEADNLAIKGVAEYYQAKGNHIVTTTVEQTTRSSRVVRRRSSAWSPSAPSVACTKRSNASGNSRVSGVQAPDRRRASPQLH